MFALSLGGDAELKPLEPWRAKEFAAYLDDARPHLAPWLPWAKSINNEAGARRWLQRYAGRQARDEGRIYGIWLADKMVGGTLFRVFDVEDGVCEIGVWLAPEAEGRGLISHAVGHMIDWAFGERGMSRIEWHCVPNNERSIAVARRLGMSRDGVLRSAFLYNGERLDVEVWSLLAADRRPPASNESQ